jgi:hypothetical protein
MLIKDLDGGSHNWLLTGNMAKGKIDNRSSLHLTARKLISGHLPTLQLLEEVPIPLRRGEVLYLDFYIPLKKICIEVHGEQHFKFVPFYHSTILNFLKAQKRDREKQEWCEINGIKYIGLRFDQNETEWSQLIQNEC